MSKVRATTEEIQAQIDQLMQQAAELQKKADDGSISGEEQTQLDELLNQIDALQQDLAAAQSSERFAKIKDRNAAPTRPAPKVAAEPKRHLERDTFSEGLRYWMLSNTADADLTSEAHYRTREAGFQIGSKAARVPCNYRNLAFKNRTVLTKGGSGSGAEYIYKTYSDKVVEYLTYFSPVVGVVSSETTSDGNLRTYFKVDDTGLQSTYLTAGGGSETTPTIPDTNITTASVDIGCFDITSGYQKVSFQELRDAHSAVNLTDKIAKANSNSHARKIEDDLINGSGNGSTGVQGLMAVDNALTPVSVSSFSQDDLEDLYYSIPQQYRGPAIWLVNDGTAKLLRQKLKDQNDRSLFDKNVIDGVEWDTFLGKRFYVSEYMDDDTILFFNPEFYQLRMVEGQVFQQFTEKFFPHTAWAGIMSFGGAWLGPTGATGAIHSLAITS